MLVELTARQVEMLLFFAYDQDLHRVTVRTCGALNKKGLIRWDDKTKSYRITDVGRALASVVAGT